MTASVATVRRQWRELLGCRLIPSALPQDIEPGTVLLHRPPQLMALCPLIGRKTSSRCHVSPGLGRRRRNWLAYGCPHFRPYVRIASYDTSPLRANSSAST